MVCKFVLNVFLGVKCYVVGQFSGYVKGNVLGGCWVWPKGFVLEGSGGCGWLGLC